MPSDFSLPAGACCIIHCQIGMPNKSGKQWRAVEGRKTKKKKILSAKQIGGIRDVQKLEGLAVVYPTRGPQQHAVISW